jgi:hypothetical protein
MSMSGTTARMPSVSPVSLLMVGACENFSASYGWPPSGRRIAVFMLGLTGFTAFVWRELIAKSIERVL